MKSIAGVALAAVMACGWAGGAEAAQVTFKPGAYAYSIVADDQDPTIITLTIGQFSDTFYNGYYSLSSQQAYYGDNFCGDFGGGYSCNENQTINYYDQISADGESKSGTYFSIDYAANPVDVSEFPQSVIYPNGDFINYYHSNSLSLGKFEISGKSLYNSSFGTADLTNIYLEKAFTINLSTVPLPASASLFGAALLGLGALGYSMKRRSHAA